MDELVAVGERARWIAVEAVRSGLPETCVVEVENTDKAIEYLHDRIGEGDVVEYVMEEDENVLIRLTPILL